MRLGGASLLLVLLALLLAAGFAAPPAWAGSCHTMHADFYCDTEACRGALIHCGRRSVKSKWDWQAAACVPEGCSYSVGTNTVDCGGAIQRYGCSWWAKKCHNFNRGGGDSGSYMWIKFRAGAITHSSETEFCYQK